jgi:hypothetical protein
MGRTRTSIAIFLGILIATPIVGGCGGASPPEQSGTQLLAGRDFGNLFFWNENTPAFTRGTTTPGADNQDLWIWPDGESAPLLALSQIDWSPPVWSSKMIVGDILMTGAFADRVYDLQGRTSLNLETFGLRGMTVEAVINWASVRRDGGSIVGHLGSGDLFAGRGSNIAFVPPPYVSWEADFMGTDLAVRASASIDNLDDEAIYRLALPSGDLTTLPVPHLSPTVPSCLSFAMPPCQTFRVVGCGDDDAVCPETGRAPCAILYLRADVTTAVAQPYVFDVNTGQETALPGGDPSAFVLSPDRHSAAWMHSDIDDTSSGKVPPDQEPIYVHNFCSGAAVQCPLPHPVQLSWRGDGGELVVDLDDNQLGLVDVPTGSCSVLTGNVRQHAFSPAGDRLAWVEHSPVLDSSIPALWMGDAAGGGRRIVAYDVPAFTFSRDGQGIFIIRADSDHFSLSWVSSLASNSQHQQPIADAYNGDALRGNQRVLVIDHWNSQDASGNLELVDIASGTHQVLAHAVTDLAASGSIDGAARVMYAVRGRFASGQDGLWQTTLPTP